MGMGMAWAWEGCGGPPSADVLPVFAPALGWVMAMAMAMAMAMLGGPRHTLQGDARACCTQTSSRHAQ